MQQVVFMIHGMWGGGWQWENYRGVFEPEGYRCVAPTLPYHDVQPGSAPDPRLGTTSLLDYAGFLEAEIGKLDSPPILIGHSMGGLLAQMLSARGLARAAVLLTPASPRGIICIKPSVLRSFWSSLTRWGFWNLPTFPTFGEAVYGMMHLMPVEDQRVFYERMVHESGRAAFEIGFWLLDRRAASRVDSAAVTCPMLVVGAAQDRITPASVVRAVAKRYRATYKEFPDHAHMVICQPGWQNVAEFVADWLKSAL